MSQNKKCQFVDRYHSDAIIILCVFKIIEIWIPNNIVQSVYIPSLETLPHFAGFRLTTSTSWGTRMSWMCIGAEVRIRNNVFFNQK